MRRSRCLVHVWERFKNELFFPYFAAFSLYSPLTSAGNCFNTKQPKKKTRECQSRTRCSLYFPETFTISLIHFHCASVQQIERGKNKEKEKKQKEQLYFSLARMFCLLVLKRQMGFDILKDYPWDGCCDDGGGKHCPCLTHCKGHGIWFT